MSQADAPAADWYPDPSGRFQFRYWDGETWTGHVSTDGQTDWDPPSDGEPQAAEQTSGQQAGAQQSGAQQSGAQPEQSSDGSADAAWQPQGAQPTAETAPADATQQAGMASAAQAASQPAAQSPPVQESQPAQSQPSSGQQGGVIEEGEPSDANLVANQRAGLDDDVMQWLNEVAGQVEPRLSRINSDWTSQPQAEAARACAYGLLVGHLAQMHPHMRSELSLVAESHPSFTTLEAGARLDTLEQIAGDPQRSAAWLGPLIASEDPERVKMLFD